MLNNTGIWVIVPNWNGGDLNIKCLESLSIQTKEHMVLVVDNNSSDNSIEKIEKSFPKTKVLKNKNNLGFAGGVNAGIKEALRNDAQYIVLLNNDVILEKDWISELSFFLKKNAKTGSVAGKLMNVDGTRVDNTGDEYSIWGLSIPRDRDLKDDQAFRNKGRVFGPSAGAAMYRTSVFNDAGLFDEKFFAYYEDTDFNFRMQLKGWPASYEPKAIAYHATGSTSSRVAGFTTYQTTKNLPMLFWKNVPFRLLPKMLPRFFTAYSAILVSSIINGRGVPAVKGFLMYLKNIPHIAVERRKVQKHRKISTDYVWSILYKDLPPDAYKLRRLRRIFTGKA